MTYAMKVKEAVEKIIRVSSGYHAASQMEAIARKALADLADPSPTVLDPVTVEALKKIVEQRTSDEIETEGEVDPDECDFVGAYDTIILIARRALIGQPRNAEAVAWRYKDTKSVFKGWNVVDFKPTNDGSLVVEALYASPSNPQDTVTSTDQTPRCEICDWPLADSQEKGCIPGDCSYRPDDPAEQARIRRRRDSLTSNHKTDQ